MTNPAASLGSAVYGVLNAAGTVSVYNTLAPQSATPPYCVFQVQNAGVDEYTFGTANTTVITSADYLVQVLSNRVWPGEAAEVYTHIHAAMQDAAPGTLLPGYTLLRCRRASSIQFRDPDGYWHVGGVYRIDVQQS